MGALTLQTNIASVTTQKWLNISSTKQSDEAGRLASGIKITKAKDDAAGLAISTKLTIKIVSLNKSIDNGNQGVAMLQTAEGGLSTISDILTRLKELATEAASDNNATDRASLQLERAKLEAQITNIAQGTKYGATQLLAGSADSTSVGVEGATLTEANGIVSITGTMAGDFSITSAAGTDASHRKLTVTNLVTSESQTVDFALPTGTDTTMVDFSQFDLTIEVNSSLTSTSIAAPTAAIAQANTAANTNNATFGAMSGSIVITGGAGGTATVDLSNVNSLDDLVQAINAHVGTTAITASVVVANGVTGGRLVLTNGNGTDGTIDVTGLTHGSLGTFATQTGNVITCEDSGTAGGVITSTGDVTFSNMEGDLIINGTSVDVSTVDSITDLVNAINNGTAGITASNSNGKLIMTPDADTTAILIDESGVTTGATGLTDARKDALAHNTFSVESDGATTTFTFQLGDTSASYNKVTAVIGGVDLTGLGLNGLAVWENNDDGTAEDAYLDAINDAIDVVNDQRASIGSFQSQIGYQVSNLTITVENTQSANSTIKDTDYAASFSEFTKYQVMSQAGVAILAQVNQIPQQILSLLRG